MTIMRRTISIYWGERFSSPAIGPVHIISNNIYWPQFTALTFSHFHVRLLRQNSREVLTVRQLVLRTLHLSSFEAHFFQQRKLDVVQLSTVCNATHTHLVTQPTKRKKKYKKRVLNTFTLFPLTTFNSSS